MWVVLIVCVVCLASLSLPWPGIIIVASVCCLAFFEFAAPLSRAPLENSANEGTAKGVGKGKRGIIGAPAAVVTRVLQVAAEALHRWRGDQVKNGKRDSPTRKPSGSSTGRPVSSLSNPDALGTRAALPRVHRGDESDKKSAFADPLATFLKGAIGSFSRGGLMVTSDGRVIYKINQDRGLIAHPSLNKAQHTIFGIFDGHGENGEHVASYTMREMPRRLAAQADAMYDPATALKRIFEEINTSLPKSGINALFGGTTAVMALVRDSSIWVANAGDSRAIVGARRANGEGVAARALTWDQNPDSPGERERIEKEGGFVSEPEEPGASARVWLDATQTMVGLAMARSIGDLAVKRVGVIAEPVVTEYELAENDEFLVLASDGVWEFIDNQEAAELVGAFLDRGEDAASACKGLMELANRRWSDMVGDYRDDITATVVRLPFLPPPAAAAAAAVAKSARGDGYPSIAPGVPVADGVPVHFETPGRKIFASETARDSRERMHEEKALAPNSSAADGGTDAGGGGDAEFPPSSEGEHATGGDALAEDWDDGAASAPRNSRLGTCAEDDGEAISMGTEGTVNDARGLLGGEGQDRCRPDDDATATEPGPAVVTPAIACAGLAEEDETKKSSRLAGIVHETLVEGASPSGSLEGIGGTAGRQGKGRGVESNATGGEVANAATGQGLDSGLGGGLKDNASPDGYEDDEVSYKVTRASRRTDAMEDLGDEEAMTARKAKGMSGGREVDNLCGVDGEEDEEDNDDWDLNYGAREMREPSREMREASREFHASPPGVDPLETLVKAGEDKSRMA